MRTFAQRQSQPQQPASSILARSNTIRIQPRLAVNTPRDSYEQEADRVSEQVMRMPEPRLQLTCPLIFSHTIMAITFPD